MGLSATSAFTVLGTGSSALLGGDLTDPEDDGDDSTAAGTGFNWVSTTASEKNHFGYLRDSLEFRLRVADRAQRALFNGDGATAKVTYRCPSPYAAGTRQFIKATFVSR